MPDHNDPTFRDGLGRSLPPLTPLSRRDAARLRYSLREGAAGHLDAAERAALLLDVDDQVDARGLYRADAHRACGLDPGTLDDASLSTDALRAAVAVLRGLPTP